MKTVVMCNAFFLFLPHQLMSRTSRDFDKFCKFHTWRSSQKLWNSS